MPRIELARFELTMLETCNYSIGLWIANREMNIPEKLKLKLYEVVVAHYRAIRDDGEEELSLI